MRCAQAYAGDVGQDTRIHAVREEPTAPPCPPLHRGDLNGAASTLAIELADSPEEVLGPQVCGLGSS